MMKPPIRSLGSSLLLLMLMASMVGGLKAEPIKLAATDFPPYEFAKPENGLRGFDVEVIEAAMAESGKTISITFLPWKRAVELTKLGGYAAVLSCSRNADREKFMTFSDPISYTSRAYFVRKDFKGFEPSNKEQAKGRKVGVVLGWTHQKEMEAAEAEVSVFRSEELLFRDLLKQRVDYAYLSYEASGFRALQLGLSSQLRALRLDNPKPLHLCFSKKWPGVESLQQDFNKGLEQIQASGRYQEIHQKYR